MKALTSLQRVSPLTRVLLLGGVLELLFILICLLLPFSITHPVYSASDSHLALDFCTRAISSV